MDKFAVRFCISILAALAVLFVSVAIARGVIVDQRALSYLKAYEDGYMAACKDAYQGKLRYILVKHADGTVTWEKAQETKENKHDQKN